MVNVSNGARVGVSEGMRVGVALALGLGEAVKVGGIVCVGATVRVTVALGSIVKVDNGLGDTCWLQANSDPAIKQINKNDLRRFLFGDGEEGVMIIDLPVRKCKGIIAITDKSLSRGCSPGEVA